MARRKQRRLRGDVRSQKQTVETRREEEARIPGSREEPQEFMSMIRLMSMKTWAKPVDFAIIRSHLCDFAMRRWPIFFISLLLVIETRAQQKSPPEPPGDSSTP